MNKKLNRLRKFRHKLIINQDSETIEICTEIKRNRNLSKSDLSENRNGASTTLTIEDGKSIKYLSEINDRIKSDVVYDSMKSYLNNITNIAVNSVYPNEESEQDDETSIQEIIKLNINDNEKNLIVKNNYEVHQINSDERVDEIDDFRKYVYSGGSKYLKNFMNEPDYNLDGLQSPIEGANIIKLVEKLPDIQDFDETVAIVESVIIDHVSEDDKSSSSDEVTYEKWTEETKLIKTKIFKDGQFFDEKVEETTPELVGNILREKLVERHEHITHISQDVLKLVKVKSPGQSKRQSLDASELINENLDGSNIIIVEPTVPSTISLNNTLESSQQPFLGSKTTLDNVYYIQHQQIITPNGRKLHTANESGRKYCLDVNTANANTSSNNFTTFNLTHNFNDFSNCSNFVDTSSNKIFNAPVSITLQYLNKLCSTDFAQEKFIKLNTCNSSNSAKSKSKYRSKLLSLNKKYFGNSKKSSVASITTTNCHNKQNHNITLAGVCTTSSETDDLSLTSSATFLKSMSVCCDSNFENSLKNTSFAMLENQNANANANFLLKNDNKHKNLNKYLKNKEHEHEEEEEEGSTKVQIYDCNQKDESDFKINNVTTKSKNRLRNNLGNLFSKTDFDDPLNEWTSNRDSQRHQTNENLNSSPIPFLVESNNIIQKTYDSVNENIEDQTFPLSYEMANIDFDPELTYNNKDEQKSIQFKDFDEYLESRSNISSSKENVLIEQEDMNLSLNTLNNTDNTKTDESTNALLKAQPEKPDLSLNINKTENSETTTSELESMERFERPSKFEMEKKQAEKQKHQKEQLEKQQREREEKEELGALTPINTYEQCLSEDELNKLEQKSFLNEKSSPREAYSEQYEKEMTENNSDIIELNTEMIDLISNAFSNQTENRSAYSNSYQSEKQASLIHENNNQPNKELSNNNDDFDGKSNTNSNKQQNITNSSSQKKNQLKLQHGNDDMTDVSDDEQNIFSSANLEKINLATKQLDANVPYTSVCSLSTFFQQNNSNKSRNLPLRRESFEMAQKLKSESISKRLSISSASANDNRQNELPFENHNLPKKLSTETDSSAQSQPILSKRMLSEIKPTNNNSTTTNSSENEDSNKQKSNTILKSTEDNSILKKPTIPDLQDSSDSSESSSNILRRNYEILRRKTNEKLNKSGSTNVSHKEEESKKHLVILSNEDHADNADLEETLEVSFSSTNSLLKCKPVVGVESSLDSSLNKPAKIKIVKKHKAPESNDIDNQQDFRVRSISPGLLRRGPDVIETIETTTSMSFIMNKNVNLIVEERRTSPRTDANQSIRLTNAISQPQLYQTKIDDLLSMADNLIRNSNKQTCEKETLRNLKKIHQFDESKESSIPITIQSRSKSEPKLIENIYNNSNLNNYYLQQQKNTYKADEFDSGSENKKFYYDYDLKKSNEFQQQQSLKNRITFHKYDSNEIIAVVNMPQAYETTTIESVNNKESINSIINSNLKSKTASVKRIINKNSVPFQQYNNEQTEKEQSYPFEITLNKSFNNTNNSPQFNFKNFSKSVPNLNDNEQFINNANFVNTAESSSVKTTNINKFKLDSWKKMPEYIVEQDTDTSFISNSNDFKNNEEQNSIWIKNELSPFTTTTTTTSNMANSNKSKSKKNVEFEIEVEQRFPNMHRASVTFDCRKHLQPDSKVYSSKDGRISIENVGLYQPSNEINVQSDMHNFKNNCDPYASYTSGVGSGPSPEAMATRMSSGYFSGDEFRSYYNSTNTNYANYINMNCNSHNGSSSNSPNTINESSSTTTQFNINKFLNNKTKYKSDDALEEFNKMYKSLGLEEDEALLDRANARDYPMYGKINHIINSDLDTTLQIPTVSGAKYRSKSVYDEIVDNNGSVAAIQRQKSIFSRKSAIPDTFKDDMARVRMRSINQPEFEKNFYTSQTYLSKSPSTYDCGFISNEQHPYSSSYSNFSSRPFSITTTSIASTLNQPNIKRDDASVLNINRKRSNSMTSINNDALINPLILPSPTSADYLRNRTRENALINVYMNPVKTTSDFEISQILYDDMAYRQLRKDSDACKLSQIKSTTANTPITSTTPTPQQIYFPAKLTNITTLPKSINYSDYYHQTFTGQQQQQPTSQRQSNTSILSANESFNSTTSSNSNNIKTVKMVKQKDATNKNLKQKELNSNNMNFTTDASRYFTNASNHEINEYYDTLNQIGFNK